MNKIVLLMASMTFCFSIPALADKPNRENFATINVSVDLPSMERINTTILNRELTVIASGADLFNDPFYSLQTIFLESKSNTDGIGIGSVVVNFSPLRPIEIGVIDGSFFSGFTDIDLTNGQNFVRNAGADYLIDPASDNTCESGHGSAVSSIIGALQDNGVSIAGIADVDIVVANALECNAGELTFLADAIVWLAGGRVEDYYFDNTTYPIKDTPVDIINMSLGAYRLDLTCPIYLQESINFAISKGVLLVSAAGNNNALAGDSSPSNCEGIIVVGSVEATSDLSGFDKTSFSNFGQDVNISAPGKEIVAPSISDNEVMLWSGTSFSSPIYVGLSARLKQQLPNAEWKIITDILDLSSSPFNDTSICYSQQCGSGVINAKEAVKMASSITSNNALVTATPILANTDFCDDKLYETSNRLFARLCRTYELIIPSIGPERTVEIFQLNNSTNRGLSFPLPENAISIATTNDPRFLLSNLDENQYDYGFRVCDAGQTCSEALYRIALNSQQNPDSCSNR